MAHTTATVSDAESVLPDDFRGGMWMLADDLDCESLGFTVLTLEANEDTMSHDHVEDGIEEVYFVVTGGVDVDVEGRTVSLEENEAIHVTPDEERHIRNRGEFSKLVLVSAPA